MFTDTGGMSQETINGLLAIIVPVVTALLAFILNVLMKVHVAVNSAHAAALKEAAELRKIISDLGGRLPPIPPDA